MPRDECKIEDGVLSSIFGKIPSKGRAIVVVGDKKVCKPCVQLSSDLRTLEPEFDGKIVELDFNEFNKALKGCRISSMPFIMFVEDGKVLVMSSGASRRSDFIDQIRSIFGKEAVGGK